MSTNREWLVLLLSLALAFILVACDSNDDAAGDTPAPESSEPTEEATSTPEPTLDPSPAPTVESTAEPSPTPTPEPSPTSEPDPTSTPEASPASEPTPDEPGDTDTGYTVEDLEAFLLSSDDVPDGWTQIPSFGQPTENSPCDTVDPPITLVDAPTSQIDFEREDGDSLIGHIVMWFENEEDAVSGMGWFDSAFQCDGRDDEMGTIQQVIALPFPAVGDESFAWELTIKDGDELVIVQYAFVRENQFLSLVAQGGIEAPDIGVLEGLVREATDKPPD